MSHVDQKLKETYFPAPEKWLEREYQKFEEQPVHVNHPKDQDN